MNLEVNPEEFVSSIESLRTEVDIEGVAVEWVNTIMKKIQADKARFLVQIKEEGYYTLSYHKIYDGFPNEYEIRRRIEKILCEQYKLNLQFEPEFKYYMLKISLQ